MGKSKTRGTLSGRVPRRQVEGCVSLLRGGAAVVAAGLLAILLYLPALRGGFVRDDHDLIERNPVLHDQHALETLLMSDFWSASGTRSGMWRPLVSWTYAADARGGASPRTFPWADLLLHAATSGLVFLVALALGWTPVPAEFT